MRADSFQDNFFSTHLSHAVKKLTRQIENFFKWALRILLFFVRRGKMSSTKSFRFLFWWKRTKLFSSCDRVFPNDKYSNCATEWIFYLLNFSIFQLQMENNLRRKRYIVSRECEFFFGVHTRSLTERFWKSSQEIVEWVLTGQVMNRMKLCLSTLQIDKKREVYETKQFSSTSANIRAHILTRI